MEYPQRKNLRLTAYDYSSQGAYFVTICTQNRRCVLSKICRGDPCGRPPVTPSPYGEAIIQVLHEVENRYDVSIDPYVIMPNHIHFICLIDQAQTSARVALTLGRIVGALKSLSANRCRELGLEGKLWQRGYYEHIIRNDFDFREIWNYIDTNPVRWLEDRFYTE